jgi:hypothetical protein
VRETDVLLFLIVSEENSEPKATESEAPLPDPTSGGNVDIGGFLVTEGTSALGPGSTISNIHLEPIGHQNSYQG